MNSTQQTLFLGTAALSGLVLLALINWKKSSPIKDAGVAATIEVKAATVTVADSGSHPGLHDPRYDNCIYCDYNATTPIYVEVKDAILPYLTACFGNPSSSHAFGKPCKNALITSRTQIGRLVNATNPQQEIYFTSCGTESDNFAIDIALHNYRQQNDAVGYDVPKVITSAIEHPAILNYLKHLQKSKFIDLVILGVDSEGFVNLAELERSLSDNTALVTIMHSNNEVGTIQPLRRISKLIHSYNERRKVQILLHSDAAQSLGKVLVDVQALGIDMLTIVGHKFGAPKGVAALYVKEGVKMQPMLFGGGQERGMRAGTENVAYCVALGEASRIAYEEADSTLTHYLTLKTLLLQQLESLLINQLGKVRFNGPQRSSIYANIQSDMKMLKVLLKSQKSQKFAQSNSDAYEMIEQLPNTISVSFCDLIGHEIVEKLGDKVRIYV